MSDGFRNDLGDQLAADIGQAHAAGSRWVGAEPNPEFLHYGVDF
jgi:hypothetical protein